MREKELERFSAQANRFWAETEPEADLEEEEGWMRIAQGWLVHETGIQIETM